MTGVDPYRDAYGVVLAFLDGDMGRVADLLDGYDLALPECHLLLSLLAILTPWTTTTANFVTGWR